ncbi:MAG: glutamate-cysteine ligase family protein [Longimicrobiales bacterium]|nr:glutamate-cysteine ligase family protein [Longimicrobiales bacterium]
MSGDGDAPAERLGLFEAFGVELETMLVDAETLSVRPECDELVARVGGSADADVEFGDIAWSNELTLHVLELKTNGPAPSLSGLTGKFHEGIRRANQELASMGARLMPGAVHPWMDPHIETRLWPHEYTEVYHTFDRIFGCSGHGWANLQSTHLNLPFADDEEFGRLHAAIRLVLPLIPALSAASPYLDGARTPELDARLVAYRSNARRVPSVTGLVVPEPAFTRDQYEREILGRIYADMAPLDPDGILRHEWANARGAIARFDRGSVEVRIIDAQECPAADLAVVAAVTEVVRALAVGPLALRDPTKDPGTEALAAILERTTADGERAELSFSELLRVLGLDSTPRSAGDVWKVLLDRFPPSDPDDEWTSALEGILGHGPLGRRLVAALGESPDRGAMSGVFGDLCGCLERNEVFEAG